MIITTEDRRFYDTAEICGNGHVITLHYESLPVERKSYCPLCNALTIHECPSCHTAIQGCYHRSYRDSPSQGPNSYKGYCQTIKEKYVPPAYCYNCGSPFAWTKALIAEADKIIEMMSELTPDQKEELKLTFPDLIAETSSTISSSLKFGKLLKPVDALLINALQAATGNFIVAAAVKFLPWQP